MSAVGQCQCQPSWKVSTRKHQLRDKSVPNNNIGESVNSSFNLGEGGLKNDPHVIWGGGLIKCLLIKQLTALVKLK